MRENFQQEFGELLAQNPRYKANDVMHCDKSVKSEETSKHGVLAPIMSR